MIPCWTIFWRFKGTPSLSLQHIELSHLVPALFMQHKIYRVGRFAEMAQQPIVPATYVEFACTGVGCKHQSGGGGAEEPGQELGGDQEGQGTDSELAETSV